MRASRKTPISIEEKKLIKVLLDQGVLKEVDEGRIRELSGGELMVTISCPDGHRVREHHDHMERCCNHDIQHHVTRHGGALAFADKSPLVSFIQHESGVCSIPRVYRLDLVLAYMVKTVARSSISSIHFPCGAVREYNIVPHQVFQLFAAALEQTKAEFRRYFPGRKGEELANGVIPVVFVCMDGTTEEMYFFDIKKWVSFCAAELVDPYWK